MNTNAVIAIIVVLVVAIGGYFAFAHKATAPVTTTTNTAPVTATVNTTPEATTSAQTSTQPAPAPAQKVTVITYTDAGFSPKSVSVKVGDTVRFVNNSSGGMWVASNNHPTHTLYDGTSVSQHCSSGTNTKGDFDACKPYDPNSVYSFTFAKAGTFTYHNHLSASNTGTIVVTQ